MDSINQCSLEGVLEALRQLGIPHRLVGPARPVRKVCSLLHKEPQGLYYFTGNAPGPFNDLVDSVVICRSEVAGSTGTCSSIAVEEDPQLVFYRLCGLLFRTASAPGIHPTAIVHPDAEIGERVSIGPYAVIGRSRIGDDSVIHAHVVVMDGCEIGKRVVIEAHSCIGATGVAWIWDDRGERVILPQLGGVTIGDEVFLGTDVTVVRGMINEATTIEQGCMIAHGTKIGHSVRMGPHCHVANNVSIAGSAQVGARSFLGAGCSLRPHAILAEGTIVGVGAAVIKNVTKPGTIQAGVPAKEMPAKEKPSGMPKPR
jgi:UDP-3-O-[3-hydroxymyristoyl] glucosamine N-acyltransferase